MWQWWFRLFTGRRWRGRPVAINRYSAGERSGIAWIHVGIVAIKPRRLGRLVSVVGWWSDHYAAATARSGQVRIRFVIGVVSRPPISGRTVCAVIGSFGDVFVVGEALRLPSNWNASHTNGWGRRSVAAVGARRVWLARIFAVRIVWIDQNWLAVWPNVLHFADELRHCRYLGTKENLVRSYQARPVSLSLSHKNTRFVAHVGTRVAVGWGNLQR